jgi:hypothetical protein
MSSKKRTDAPDAPPDHDVVVVEAAFAAGNNSAVRALAKSSSSPPARELAERLMVKIHVEKEQVLAGVVAFIVVSIAAALTLVRG